MEQFLLDILAALAADVVAVVAALIVHWLGLNK
jgi:hypothetical protein